MSAKQQSQRRDEGAGRQEGLGAQNPDPRPSDYAYTLYWARLVQGWGAERRAQIALSVEAVISSRGFRPNEFYRTYSVPGLDEIAHAGASLLALQQILAAYDRAESRGDFDV